MSITHTSGSATPNDPAVLLLRSAELDLTLEIVQVSQPASTTATVDGKVVEVTPSSILALSHLCHAISLVHRLLHEAPFLHGRYLSHGGGGGGGGGDPHQTAVPPLQFASWPYQPLHWN